MKNLISLTLFVVVSICGSNVFAQQNPDSKSTSNSTKNQSTTLSTAELGSGFPQTDPGNALNGGGEAQKHYDSAIALADKGRFADAIEAFKLSLKLRPEDPQTNYSLGLAYGKSKLYKEAYESFKRAIRFKPDWPEPHFQLGTMAYVLGKRSQAVQEYKKLIQLNSSLANILYRVINEDESGGTADERGNNSESSNSETLPAPAKVSSDNGNAETARPEAAKTADSSTSISTVPPKPAENALTEIYRVGVGDVLDIRLLNATPGRSTLFTVIAGGLIELPIAGGPITVGGLTVEEIQTLISTELKRRAVDDGTRVSVGIRQYSSHSVVVTGLVVSPGVKFMRREAVPLYVILAEAQLRNDAGRVSIMRSGTKAFELNLGDSGSMNLNALPGDVISVSGKPQEFYYIAGRVNYPGQKVFQPGITLLQAILAAGGTQKPNQNKIEISREGTDSRLVTTRINVKDIKAGRIEDPKLLPGDRIEVLN